MLHFIAGPLVIFPRTDNEFHFIPGGEVINVRPEIFLHLAAARRLQIHADPLMAQRLAEAIGRDYIRNSIERRASLSEEALRYLLEDRKSVV